MTTGKKHHNQVDIDAALVRWLLAAQFPQWADLPVAPVPCGLSCKWVKLVR